ncbi:methylenetetrahydrofolate reductase [NAD(P)H] [Barnesiella sp. WM24]|uniref:methylenetetrahydrofolate reductase [NAD(P)H] n=1 Tax=Barnesiella sp. WM24 TaxID=2558278 RepID=UPI001072E16A|nr:methylenetetrahydrofolate reductase [NAD(P)H] [Barnesiella sp. WM24]MDE6113603.1 methylenetetrahydrofolate reductase [NAD(P)H] [Muribaculum sp.]TFU94499.1 methylenetetrahydrofolate reductase [NAD(P)H] [Barnesiella sp. WM24]
MKVTDLIASNGKTGFSFEVLPPLKGRGISQLFRNIDVLKEFNPLYINITTHRSEMVYKNTPDGLYQKVSERSRPGTVAVAAAIQQKYGIPAVPHIICSGFSRIETEYALIDLNFLGITNILLLRGDKAKHENRFIPNDNGYSHATELQIQVNEFNRGYFIDGTKMDIVTGEPFSYGVAGYPEKHEEAPNIDIDIQYARQKIDNGAEYIVTQMFFDNQKYYDFVDRCRKAGINVPIIAGLKPITTMNQLNLLPKVFHVDLPMELATELMKCKSDADAKQVGVEWCKMQAADLIAHNIPSIHFYSLNATKSVEQVARAVY